MDKQFFVNVVNLETGKIFSLPTLYTDRTEACVCGQNYCRDRQVEDPSAELFFRILIAKDGKVAEPSYFTVVNDDDNDDEPCPHPEQECCEDCPFYSECWEFDEEDNDEEPEHGESVYGNAEEPSSASLAEILSVFNAVRPNY